MKILVSSTAALMLVAGAALAADLPDGAAPPAAPAAAPAPPVLLPSMTGPLVANPNPFNIDTGPFGKIYFTGVLSGVAQQQNNVTAGFYPDKKSIADLTNAQLFIQKVDGPFQFFAQLGTYSLPALGTPYLRSDRATHNYYSYIPQGFLKFAPTDAFSIQVGKLPTLLGAEYTFTFENANIDRGLLWNQENAVNRGVQANYTIGPVALSFSVNDGFYSNHYSWISGSATYTINPMNSVAFVAAGNTQRTRVNTIATPYAQNNSQIYNLIYTYTNAPITLEGYLQYSYVPSLVAVPGAHIPVLAATTSGSTSGVGLYANYSFPTTSVLSGLSLPVRLEYIATTGNQLTGPNLLNGPGSKAYSVTFTPTYQYKLAFVRGEVSFVKLSHVAPLSGFGPLANKTSQTRFKIETGIIF